MLHKLIYVNDVTHQNKKRSKNVSIDDTTGAFDFSFCYKTQAIVMTVKPLSYGAIKLQYLDTKILLNRSSVQLVGLTAIGTSSYQEKYIAFEHKIVIDSLSNLNRGIIIINSNWDATLMKFIPTFIRIENQVGYV